MGKNQTTLSEVQFICSRYPGDGIHPENLEGLKVVDGHNCNKEPPSIFEVLKHKHTNVEQQISGPAIITSISPFTDSSMKTFRHPTIVHP